MSSDLCCQYVQYQALELDSSEQESNFPLLAAWIRVLVPVLQV